MARVITPAGLDLGDIQDETLLAYYRGERYTFPDDAPAEPVSLDLSKHEDDEQHQDEQHQDEPPADVAGTVDDGVTPVVDATAGALPESTES